MRIGVLAAHAGITAKTIRFYEDTGLMPAPARTSAGYRDYPADAAARLAFIRDARAAGLTLAEIRSILAIRDNGQAPCQHVTDLIDQHLAQVEQRLADLAQARNALLALKSRASSTDPGDCPQDQVCSILTTSPDR
jgi:MerR family copper efflux transcriptional regulator